MITEAVKKSLLNDAAGMTSQAESLTLAADRYKRLSDENHEEAEKLRVKAAEFRTAAGYTRFEVQGIDGQTHEVWLAPNEVRR